MSDSERSTTADKITALRNALGFGSQEAFAEKCGVRRLDIQSLEKGRTLATSYAMREALARGADVPTAALAAYLDEDFPLDGILRLRGFRQHAEWWRAAAGSTAIHVAPPSDPKPARRQRRQRSDTPAEGSRILRKSGGS